MGVYFTQKGEFNKVERWLNSLMHKDYLNVLSFYGNKGVTALQTATPIDTGLAASSWRFQIETDKNGVTLVWINDDIEGGCNVAVLIDRGHVSKSGSWVPGKHYINEALEPIINELSNIVWEEATRA